MANLSLRMLTASLLSLPLLAFAGPPAGHGNGNGNSHGNGSEHIGAQPGTENADDQGEHGRAAHGQGRNGSTGGQSGESDTQAARGGQAAHGSRGALGQSEAEDDAAGGGRANSQGAAHANYHAIQAVCSHPNAAAHSALGIYCPGVVGVRDARTGTHVYTQPGMELAPAPAPTTRPRTGTIKHSQLQPHKPAGDHTEAPIPAKH